MKKHSDTFQRQEIEDDKKIDKIVRRELTTTTCIGVGILYPCRFFLRTKSFNWAGVIRNHVLIRGGFGSWISY